MSLVELPLVWEFPSDIVYRLNVWCILEALGIDIRKLSYVRAAVQMGVFTEYPEEPIR